MNTSMSEHMQLLSQMPLMLARGNHEDKGTLLGKYWSVDDDPAKHYYSFDYGPLHVTIIDNFEDCSPSSTQLAWVEQDLRSTAKPFKVVVFHCPPWSAGPHSINFADECVGVLLDALDASPYRDNTVVMLWSDHGLHQGEKFQFAKFTLWEEAARCVLICAGPGIEPGTRCDQPVNLIDMYPTLVELCRLAPRTDLGGISFLPQLKDPSCEREHPSITANAKGFSVRTERWRYIAYRDGSEELYDHDKDPMEWDNLANKPDLAKIKNSLKAFVPENPAPAPARTKPR